MNKHLNIFRTYAKDNRRYQLENDLTRALAICLQEDTLFFHEVLKAVFGDTDLYNQLFEDPDRETVTEIEIQKKTKDMPDFERVFAVSLSESPLSDFWAQTRNSEYDPICDLVITIDNILIIIEAKRDNIDCTAQLYNQIHNTLIKKGMSITKDNSIVSPFDLNWQKLMTIAVKVANFEKMTGNSNRFLTDFIQLVKGHNFMWLPETPIGSLHNQSRRSILRRVESAVLQANKQEGPISIIPVKDRLCTSFKKPWARELIFDVDKNTGELIVSIYPGMTKNQGKPLFRRDKKISKQLFINGQPYPVKKKYNIRFSSYGYICGLWLNDSDFTQMLYTKENFDRYSGRFKRDQWPVIENLLSDHINLDWKCACNWNGKLINSNRKQFDMVFAYEVWIAIPFERLAELDLTHDDISPLSDYIESIYIAFESDLLSS